ncbi:MAG: Nif11-like leader peptide family RiPP precursor [Holophagales bacterium]|nr:Nif11-like leader peptide family RiPP precursor [Holophagales bacterium]
MSQSEIERFVSDVKNNEELLKELTEGVIGLDELVSRAGEKGYEFTAEEAKAFAMSQAEGEISDDQLDMVAGGQNLEGANDVPVTVLVGPTQATVVVVAAIIAAVAGSQH